MPTLVLLRHGESTWNKENRFTGWTDVDLTPNGMAEARRAGQLLKAEGYGFDLCYTSVLKRAIRTLWTVLDEMDAMWLPVVHSWRLNERHYGALQGMSKKEIFAVWGEERSRAWWRGYHTPPPALAWEDPRHPRFDPRYADLDPAVLPIHESLRDCQQRMLPYWLKVLAPRVAAGRRLLVISHGNTLRGLVMHLERLTAEEMEKVEIPSGIPLIYRLSADLEVTDKAWLAIA